MPEASCASGNSPGTLTLGSTTFDSASTLNYQLNTPGIVGSGVNDLTEVLGNLALAGTLNVSGLTNFGAGVYRLSITPVCSRATASTIGSLPAGFTASIDTSIGGQVNLDVASVPEPARLALGAMGVAVLAAGRAAHGPASKDVNGPST